MSQSLQTALIGPGRWGSVLAREFSPHLSLQIVVGKGDAPAWLSELEQTPLYTNDLSSTLADKTIDAVLIATPIETHFEIAKQALEAGKHVFVEKPIARTQSEVDELYNLAEHQECALFTDYPFLYSDVFQEVKKHTPIKSLECTWLKCGSFGEVLVENLLVHDLALVISLLGEPDDISITRARGHITKCDTLGVELTYPDTSVTILIDRLQPIKEKIVKLATSDSLLVWRDDSLFSLDSQQQLKECFKAKQSNLTCVAQAFIEVCRHPNNDQRRKLDASVVKTMERITRQLL